MWRIPVPAVNRTLVVNSVTELYMFLEGACMKQSTGTMKSSSAELGNYTNFLAFRLLQSLDQFWSGDMARVWRPTAAHVNKIRVSEYI
jgi:hypothetical protein